jgi:hypothetical protein
MAVVGASLMNVVKMQEYRCRDIVAALEYTLAAAKRGDIRALAMCAKDSRGKEHIAFVGEYLDNPALGVNAANRMSWRLTQMQDEMDAAASHL